MNPITIADLLMVKVDDRALDYPPKVQMLINGDKLLVQINRLQDLMQVQFTVSSGYRPGTYNVKAGGAKNSTHLTCEAIDLHDDDGMIKHKLQSNVHILEEHGLYMESPVHTPGWCHLQTRPTRSRIFIP